MNDPGQDGPITDDDTLSRAQQLVHELSVKAGIETPEVRVNVSEDVICSVQLRQGKLVVGVNGAVTGVTDLESELRAAIAHEIGHIVCGHLSNSPVFCYARMMLADVLHLARLDRFNPLWRCEIEADRYAAHLVGKEAMIGLLNNCRQTLAVKGKPDRGTLEHPCYGARIAILEAL